MGEPVVLEVHVLQTTPCRYDVHERGPAFVEPYTIYKICSEFAQIRCINILNPSEFYIKGYVVIMTTDDLAVAEMRIKLSPLSEHCYFEFYDVPLFTKEKHEKNLCDFTAELSMQSVENPTDNIFATLHDYCLEPIFEQPAISATDLMSLAYTCERFYSSAKKAFRTKEIDARLFDNMELWQAERFFRTFGKDIRFIKLFDSRLPPNDILVQFALQYCKKIEKFGGSVRFFSTLQAIQPIVPDLEELHIDCCYENLNKQMDILFNSSSVYRLKKMKFNLTGLTLPVIRLPHLSEVSLTQKGDQMKLELLAFFELNPQITKFELMGWCHQERGIDCILNMLPNLKELIIETEFDKYILHSCSCFRRLHQLKCLTIIGNNAVFCLEELYAADIRLTKLSITTAHNSYNVAEAICEFKSLRHLEINRSEHGLLMKIVEQLKDLEEIHVKVCNTFHTVRDVLNTGTNLKKVRIGVSTDRGSMFEHELLLFLMDKNLLRLIDIINTVKCVDLMVKVLIRTPGDTRDPMYNEKAFHNKWMKATPFCDIDIPSWVRLAPYDF